ncbi:carbohydrate ABC transporter permease [Pumilibacter intestinalis]|uniref:carbohydrate ABC transporter permease n=1 Tax=Pumilibacter intestinalis TaxID=2941511 RepID=UPI00203DF241|nr:sugar ABC transporter permease [Pumilibacter intestinalis]
MEIALRKTKKSLRRKQHIIGYLFLTPTAVLFTVFTVIPFIMAFYLAFHNYNLLEVKEFVGFEYFATSFKNAEFMKAFLNILIYAVIFVPFAIITSLLAAVLGNSRLRGAKLMRVIFYLPSITGSIAMAYVWRWMFDIDSGVFNGILTSIGLPALRWLDSRSYFVMVCVVMVSLWSGVGNNMLIFLAALKGVPTESYEAARLDGANGFQTLIHITLPAIAPTMYFITTMSIIGAFQMFDLVYAMVPSGSMEWARTPVVMLYEIGFTRFKGGLGSAMSIILFGVIMLFTFLFQLIVKEDKTV